MKNRFKVAIVTGATSGIGKSTVSVLLARGYHIIANGKTKERIAIMEEEHNNGQAMIYGYCADVRDKNMSNDIFDFAEQKIKSNPSVFVLCAGHGLPGTLLTSDDEKWNDLLEVNILGAMRQLRECAKRFVAYSLNDGEDSVVRDIVVIGSTVGRQVSATNPVYGSTKYSLHSLVESLRQEVCTNNIRVTLIEPGFVDTEFQATAGYDMNWYNSLKQKYGPFLTPEDIAQTIDFVIQRPVHVHLDDIRIRPTRQVQ